MDLLSKTGLQALSKSSLGGGGGEGTPDTPVPSLPLVEHRDVPFRMQLLLKQLAKRKEVVRRGALVLASPALGVVAVLGVIQHMGDPSASFPF